MMPAWLTLIIAVAAETLGTTALQASQQFTRLVPSVIVVIAYVAAFWFLSLTMRHLPVGVVYALWSGLGILFIALIGFFVFGQKLDLPAILGMILIGAGIVLIQFVSKTASH